MTSYRTGNRSFSLQRQISLVPPDIDGNCQVEIAIIPIDGPGGDEGYFETGVSTLREALFIDIDDISERNRILTSEFSELIHHDYDPFEYLWVKEGAAGLSEFMSYGGSQQLEEKANSWTQNSTTSLRWWDGRTPIWALAFFS